jgi:hypothetical protein
MKLMQRLAYGRAKTLLKKHEATLHALVKALYVDIKSFSGQRRSASGANRWHLKDLVKKKALGVYQLYYISLD